MNDVAARLQDLSPEGKRVLLARLLSLQKSRGKTAPLSYAQQRLWFLEQLVSGNPFYNDSSAIRFLFPVDHAALEKSLGEIVRRHEALRTSFEARDGEPLQRVLPPQRFELPVTDLSHLPAARREAEAVRLASEHAREPFDIPKPPLLRVELFRLAPSDHIFALTMHHLVCDGWSMKVFFEELGVLYEAFSRGEPSPLPELPVQYADFTLWQREWLQGAVLEEQLEFWKGQLAGLQTLDLPTDRPRPAVPAFTGGREPISISPEVNRALQALCQQLSVTPFMALLAAYQVLLHRYTGQDDIAVGCPVANRNRPELEKLIGFFVNTLVMRTDLSGNPTFRDLLGRVREVALSAYAHQDLPFERLVEELQPERDPSRNPLFQVTFQILSDYESEGMSDQSRGVGVELPTSKFDLRCDLWYRGGGVTGYIEYSSDLFEPETVGLMARHFEALVEALVAQPDVRVADMSLLTPAEERRLLEWNETTRSFPVRGRVHERFAELAASHPGLLAVAEGTSSLTYGELNRRANQLARRLKARGIRPGSLVALLLDRSADLVLSALAALKVGAAYVPLDPTQPSERLSLMLREALVPLVLSAARHREKIPGFIPHLLLDAERGALDQEDGSDLPTQAAAGGLAYVIFTSGSTGKPRGVEVLHASLGNLVAWHQDEYRITPEDRATLYASPGFDASVWEIWPYLTAGASLHIPDAESHASPASLARWMAEAGITASFLPTPVAESFVKTDLPPELRLRVLLTGGDKLCRRPPRPLPFRFVNHYGPTENTVVATACDVEASPSLEVPPIGKPIANVQAYVLDRHLRPVPVGVKGELFLGGAGLARGYFKQAQLTEERFIPNPFDRRSGSRLYRTGDVVRFRRDGNLEFHGRVDGQIKIRGHRIEPGEIESALDRHTSVRKSLVVVQENGVGEKSLVAYVTPQRGKTGRQAGAAVQSERVEEWQQIYEEIYDSNQQPRDRDFDIVGWDSSYTGRPLSREEMAEQVEATVERVSALGGRRVLEIGCGTGLLLLRLAGGCQRYVGTDFSRAALAQVEECERERGWSHVELWERPADDFSGVEPGSFDVVVLNSVVQYFPSMDYLVGVLEGACRALRPGGYIFIGDVRSLQLLPLLHAGIELARAGGESLVGKLRERAGQRMKQEPELVIDPEFFRAFAARAEGVGGVGLEVRRGWRQNELTRFRYDAVLKVGGPAPAQPPAQEWEERRWEEFGSVAALRNYLRSAAPAALSVRAVPSARLWPERLKLERLRQADGAAPLSSLRLEETEDEAAGAVEPEQLWALEGELPYRIQVGWAESGEDECCYDVKCVTRSALSEPFVWDVCAARPLEDEAGPDWAGYGNEVLAQTSEQFLTRHLRQHARLLLPEYMVPSRFVWVEQLPLTTNGKLNRAALLATGDLHPGGDAPRSLPSNDVEAKLGAVWQELLGLERVGIYDNFFDLGGHSLLLVKLHNRLSQLFNTSLSIIDLFRLPTVSALAGAIIAERGGGTRVAEATRQ